MRIFLSTVAAAFLYLPVAFAEALIVPIPNQNWKIEMDAPPLESKSENNEDGTFFFLGKSKSFTVFLNVRPPEKVGGSNNDCFDWTKASGNPHIDKNSVETTSNARYHRVQYNRVLKAGAKTLTSTSVNYYFVFEDKWVEIEIFFSSSMAKDREAIEAFDKCLKYSKN